MHLEIVVIALLLYTCIREIFFLHSLHVLVNKLMSKHYHEYKTAETVGKQKIKNNLTQIPMEPQEDLGIMGDFSG